MKKIKKISAKRILWLVIFVPLLIVLIAEFSVLLGLRNKNRELLKQDQKTNEQIAELEQEQQYLQGILDNSQSLDDYAMKNGYYKTEDVYIVK